jgi:diguanylate cyclase (GGDEF)-like protein
MIPPGQHDLPLRRPNEALATPISAYAVTPLEEVSPTSSSWRRAVFQDFDCLPIRDLRTPAPPSRRHAPQTRVIQCRTRDGAQLPRISRTQELERDLASAHVALAHARAETLILQQSHKRARHFAMHDDLTALPNRRFLRERLEQALARKEPPHQHMALLYLGLDGFKLLDDKAGHDAGDQLLRIVAARMSRAVRAEDMVSRIGGDEFACLLGGVASPVTLRQVALKLHDAVAAPMTLAALEFCIPVSIGIAALPCAGGTVDEVLKCAEVAMYHAKDHRTRFAFANKPVTGLPNFD